MIKKTIIFSILLSFLLAPYSFSLKDINLINAETIISSSEISEDTTWTLAESPYVVSVNIIIQEGFTLTIEPGVIVKFEQNSLIVLGDLNVVGEEGGPVIFTSIHDDVRGGKSVFWSNGNPLSGDWGGIKIELNGNANLNYAIINYGGKEQIFQVDNRNIIKQNTAYAQFDYSIGAISSNGYSIEISNSKIAYNEIGVTASLDSSVLISDSKIYNNIEAGILNYNDVISINAINNWWGDNSGPYHATLNPSGQGNNVSDNVIFEPWITYAQAGQDPVIIVPGIMGSWEKGSEGLNRQWVIDPILHTYDNLIEAMLQSGYVIDENLFLFPYNWRNDNVLTADLLKEKIDEIKEETGSEKVDIVAHSMGGLISRFYVQGSEYENDVDQLIFLDTPHQGAPESYLSYEGAYVMGKLGRVKKFIFQIEAAKQGYLSLPKYIREQVISTEQLLPVYDYLQVNVNDDWQYRMYPVQYPRNTFLENLNVAPAIEVLKDRTDITNIISSAGASSTLTMIRVIPDPDIYDNKWMDGYPDDIEDGDLSGLVAGNGDGTVPYNSLDFLDGVNIVEMVDTEHREIVTKAQQDIIEILTDTWPEDYYEGPWSAIKRILFIRVYSPVDFQVIAPDGGVVGKDFVSNTEINEIFGAFYSGFDAEAEFVTIPNPQDGDYKVKLQGTGNGIYELGIDVLEDGNSIEEENLITGIISAGEEEYFNFNYKEGDETAKIEVQKEIGFDDLIRDLEELNNNSEIKKKMVYKLLHKKFRYLSKKHDKIEKKQKKKKKCKKNFNKRIIRSLEKINKKLKHYLKKNWITRTAYDVLNYDINNLINKITQ